MQYKVFPSKFSTVNKVLFITLTFSLLLQTYADSYTISSTKPPQTIGLGKSSPRVVLGLDYQNAFDMTLTSLDNSGYNFCQVYPSEVVSKLKYEVPINQNGSSSYDNALFHKDFYFLLDTETLNILAVGDLTNTAKQWTIVSDVQNDKTDQNEFFEVWFTIDEANSVLLIVTERILLSYDLKPFFKAINSKSPIPHITNKATQFTPLSSINSIKHYKGILYIVADNIVYIWLTVANGDVTPLKVMFDQDFFNPKSGSNPKPISIVDIAFYENRAYLLNNIDGIYSVNIEGAAQSIFKNEGLQHAVEKGQFIEIIGKSLNVISSTKKTTTLLEFIIGSSERSDIPTITKNRELDIFQAVSDVYSDGNFLYLITGFFNIVLRPMVPANYQSTFLDEYVMNYWSLFEIKSFVTTKTGSSSQVLAVQDTSLSLYSFEQETPALQCNIETIPEGEYIFQLKVFQTTCEDKTTDDINVICQIKQNIKFVIGANDAIGDVRHSKQVSIGLGVGIGFLLILIVIFFVLVRKYKNQYTNLQSQFKFKKLKEEGGDNSEGVGAAQV